MGPSPIPGTKALWRSGYAEVCKTLYTGSIPVGASKQNNNEPEWRNWYTRST